MLHAIGVSAIMLYTLLTSDRSLHIQVLSVLFKVSSIFKDFDVFPKDFKLIH